MTVEGPPKAKVLEGTCAHGARVRITDRRNIEIAQANVWTCAREECMHAAFHAVHDATGMDPLIVPLPPI